MSSPISPDDVDWNEIYGKEVAGEGKKFSVTICDIGSGFGGLLAELSKVFPDEYSVGLEIRYRPVEYTKERIRILRESHPGEYENIAVIKTNAMFFLPNYFRKSQLSRIFVCFADPHFKKRKHDRRVICPSTLNEFAYILQSGGVLYTITDVKDLHEWIVKHCDAHPLFSRMENTECDLGAGLLEMTDEAKKVQLNNGSTYSAVFTRVPR